MMMKESLSVDYIILMTMIQHRLPMASYHVKTCSGEEYSYPHLTSFSPNNLRGGGVSPKTFPGDKMVISWFDILDVLYSSFYFHLFADKNSTDFNWTSSSEAQDH